MEKAHHLVQVMSRWLQFNFGQWSSLLERYIHDILDKAIVSPEKIIFGE